MKSAGRNGPARPVNKCSSEAIVAPRWRGKHQQSAALRRISHTSVTHDQELSAPLDNAISSPISRRSQESRRLDVWDNDLPSRLGVTLPNEVNMAPEPSIHRLSQWDMPVGKKFLVAGPCSVESEEQVLRTAMQLSAYGVTVM